MDVIIVYNNSNQIEKIKRSDLKVTPFFTFIDESKNRKEAFSIKNRYAARMCPFVVCMNGDKAIRAFYSETGEDVIESLINYLNE